MNKIEFENGSIIETLDLGKTKVTRGIRSNFVSYKCYCIECKNEWIKEFDMRYEVIPCTDENGVRFTCKKCRSENIK